MYSAMKHTGNICHHVAQNGPSAQRADMSQLGSPYALPKVVKMGLVKYIIEMQESGIRVNVIQITQL
jgi:hypothetical protein